MEKTVLFLHVFIKLIKHSFIKIWLFFINLFNKNYIREIESMFDYFIHLYMCVFLFILSRFSVFFHSLVLKQFSIWSNIFTVNLFMAGNNMYYDIFVIRHVQWHFGELFLWAADNLGLVRWGTSGSKTIWEFGF